MAEKSEIRNLNLGMNHLITRERERLGVRLVCDDEIWQDEFSALPDYAGYEYFISNRGHSLLLSDIDTFFQASQVTLKNYPTMEKRQEVFECGYEFISIMKLAALSIGTASVYSKTSFSDLTDFFPPPETDLFWLNFIQSSIFLAMASDRLRTFFIKFVLCKSEKEINNILRKREKTLTKNNGKPHQQFVYIQGFHELMVERLSIESQQRLSELQQYLEQIASIRLKRNNFVHEYASREAMITSAERVPKKDHANVFKAFMGNKYANDYIEEIADDYKVLVKTGNLVFLLEKDVTGI